MGGRYGKYGEIKRVERLRKSKKALSCGQGKPRFLKGRTERVRSSRKHPAHGSLKD